MRSIETDDLTATTHAGVPHADLASISEAAADWFLRARDRRFTAAEERALAQWFRQSPRHIAEFLRMHQLHGLLREAKLEQFERGVQEHDARAQMLVREVRNMRARGILVVVLISVVLVGAGIVWLMSNG